MRNATFSEAISIQDAVSNMGLGLSVGQSPQLGPTTALSAIKKALGVAKKRHVKVKVFDPELIEGTARYNRAMIWSDSGILVSRVELPDDVIRISCVDGCVIVRFASTLSFRALKLA